MSSVSGLVTVFGSLHYDIMVDAPDRPRKGETVTGTSWRPKCGGKGGNQAVAAASAGATTAMIGAVGDDAFGRSLLDNLVRKGVDCAHVRVEDGVASGMSVAIFDASGDYGAVIVSASNLTLGLRQVSDASEILSRTAILLLQNEIPEAANVAAAGAVRRANGRVILNAAPARRLPDALLALTDVLVVNAIEAEMLCGVAVADTLSGAQQAADALLAVCAAAIVTVGGDGVAYAERGGRAFAYPGVPVTVASTHGAGDAFVGTLAAALARGEAVADAVSAANAAAAALVSTPEALRV